MSLVFLGAIGWARPWLFAALALLPLYGWLRRRLVRRSAVAFAPLQYASRRPWPGRLAAVELPLELLLLGLLILGLAGPYRQSEVELIEDDGIDVMLVLDVSLSMLAEDFTPNRLAVLRNLAGDFIARAGGQRIGLVIFAKDAYVQTPLTTDHFVLRELLQGVTVYALNRNESGGTAIGDALLVAGDRLRASRVEGRDQALILITDGESNDGIDPLLAARSVHQEGIRLYTIGVGGETPIGITFEGRTIGGDRPYQAFLDDRQLRALSEAAQGRYWRATDAGALEEIFGELSRLASAPLGVRRIEHRDTLTPPIATLALVLFAALIALSSALRRPLA